jgi:aspartyl/glutamyl-tRNA(Asn/Gln) amidotransferase C subunit
MSSNKTLTKDDVLHVAKLAKLSLSDEEVETYTKQLEDVVTHMKQLDEIDVADVPSTTHPIDLQNVTFEDGKSSGHQFNSINFLKTKEVDGKTYFIVDRVL